jgi:hypothetical protein
MQFRVGHEVRYQTIIEASTGKEAAAKAETIAYDRWDHTYLVMEDVVPLDESPVNPHAE